MAEHKHDDARGASAPNAVLEDALGAYWDCAYQEGRLGRADGNIANALLHEVRNSVRRLVEAEREACAKVCDKLHHKWHWGEDNPDSGPNDCAAEIRKRSNAQCEPRS